MKTINENRRNFLKKAGALGLGLPFSGPLLASWPEQDPGGELEIHMFSKHLQFLDYGRAGEISADLGFAGLDMTVRPKGHVEPERVKEDLPAAVKAIRKAGSDCQIITTAVGSVHNPVDVEVLETAAEMGIGYYRSNWFRYPEEGSMEDAIDGYAEQVRELGELNRRLGLIGCYQNHSGIHVGSSFWEVQMILEKADPEWFGSEFDIRHFTVEGGKSWVNALRLLHKHIKVIVVKDFKWGRKDGKWVLINTPIGEGMVDFHRYFRLLKEYDLKPPVTLHLEYPIGGAEHGDRQLSEDENVVYNAMKKDLARIQMIWKES